MRDLAVLSLAFLLAVSLTVGPAQASAAASATVVAKGTVTSSGGTAMPGVTVELYAWPSDTVLKTMKPGRLVPTTLLATVTTGGSGKYVLTVPTAKLKAAAVESGYANLEIFSPVGGFSFLPYQTGSLSSQASSPVTVNLTGRKGLSCGTHNGYAYYFTGMSLERQRGHPWAVVGQGYIAKSSKTSGDSIGFNYDRTGNHSQSSTLGVGLSGYGFDAGYKASGTRASTSTQEQDYASQEKSSWFRTEFSVAQFRGICYAPEGATHVPHEKQHGQCPRTWTDTLGEVHPVHKCFWMLASVGWFGSASLQHPKQIPNTPGKYCGYEPKGQIVKTTDEQAIDWSDGFELGASLGVKGANLKGSFSGSAETGYDDNAQMVFKFAHGGYLCGTNHDPSRASLLVTRSRTP
jgi:hypothetical protein